MKTCQFKIAGTKYDLIFGVIGFGFHKYSFSNTSMTFLFDWELFLGFIAIRKWQTKSFEELKKISDIEWNKKWKK